MNRKKTLWQLLAIIMVVFLLVGCNTATIQPSNTPTPVPSTATIIPPTSTSSPVPPTATFTPVPPTSTATPVPPTEVPPVQIRLGPGKFGQPIWLEVITGDFQLVSGTTLETGSAIGVSENDLTFSPGLSIDVEGGAITLKGTSYPAGTQLTVDAQGNLISKGR